MSKVLSIWGYGLNAGHPHAGYPYFHRYTHACMRAYTHMHTCMHTYIVYSG